MSNLYKIGNKKFCRLSIPKATVTETQSTGNKTNIGGFYFLKITRQIAILFITYWSQTFKFCIRRRRMNSSSFHLGDLMVYLSFEIAPEKVVPRRLRPATLSAYLEITRLSLHNSHCHLSDVVQQYHLVHTMHSGCFVGAGSIPCRVCWNSLFVLIIPKVGTNISHRDIDRLHTIPLPSERVMILIGVPLDQWSTFCLSVYPDKFKCVLTDVHNFWTAISCYNIFSGKSTI